MELDPSVGALLKIGKCSEHDGKLALALHDYNAVLVLNRQQAGQTERRRVEVEQFTKDFIYDSNRECRGYGSSLTNGLPVCA